MTQIVRIRVQYPDSVSDLEVVLAGGATVGDLAAMIGVPASDIRIDGRALDARTGLDAANLRNGSTVAVGTDDAANEPTPLVELDQIAGLAGGTTTPLPQGRFEFSPASGAGGSDEDVSFTMEVDRDGRAIVAPRGRPIVIDDVVIRTPTELGSEVLNAGSARFDLRRPAAPESAGEFRLRSPRMAVTTVRHIDAPELPEPQRSALSLVWLSLFLLAVVFAVLGVAVHQAFFVPAVLAIVAGLVHIVRTIRDARRRHRKDVGARRKAIASFAERVRTERRSVAAELRGSHPSIADLVRAVGGTGPDEADVWQRRVGDHDFAQVSVGLGELPWKIATGAGIAPELQAVVDGNDLLSSVPIEVDLADGPIGIVGDRASALACTRAVVASLAAQSPVEELRFALAAPAARLVDWDWLKWLPHFDHRSGVATSMAEADRMVARWRTPGHHWMQVVIADEAGWTTDDTSILATVAAEPGKQCVLVVAERVEDLPDCAATIVIGADGQATVTVLGDPHRFVTPVGASVEATERIARGLARLEPMVGDDGDRDRGSRPFGLAAPEPEQVTVPRSPSEQRRLVPPPVPAHAQVTAQVEGAAERLDPESSPPDIDLTTTVDLRERLDALAQSFDSAAADADEYDPFA